MPASTATLSLLYFSYAYISSLFRSAIRLPERTPDGDLSLYQYQPLTSNRSTRVFTLLPAWRTDAPVQGTLSEVNIDADPRYEGLSYLCGNAAAGYKVQIIHRSQNGVQNVSRLSVTPNCHAALRRLRRRFTSRTLWIDSISIDQAPTAEKSQQVAMMTEIYEHAKSVVIWLNPEEVEDAGVARAARLFRLIGWLYRLRLLRVYERDEQTDMKMPRATRLVTACDRYIEARSQQLGDAFNAPFLNRYFRRVWTVQEIAMAHNIRVYYGVATISWQDFVVSGLFTVKQGGFARNQASETDVFRDSELHWDLLNALESHFVLPDIYGLEALSTKASIKSTKNRYTLGTLELALIKSKGLEATEPKDKAYAMLWTFLGLEQGVGPLRDVDYAKPLDQVYTEFSTAVFVRTNGSTVQFYWVNSVPRNTALPSWVPDWSVSTSMSLFVWCQKLRDFRAARSDSLQYRIGIEGPRLLISGVRHCGMKAFIRLSAEGRQRILHNRDPGQLIEALIDAAELMRSLIEVAKSHTSYDGEESLLSAIHRIIHSQRHLHVPGTEDQQEFFARPKEVELSQSLAISVGLLRLRIFHGLSPLLDESSLSRQVIQDALEPVLLDEEMDEVLERASELPNLTPFLALVVALSPFIDLYHFLHIIVLDHRDKDMFITDQGALGMAFQGLQSDDIVALWQGCPSPMIVRKAAADGGELYRLHGPAFVDGIMLGEGWPVDKTELKEFQVV